MYSLHDGWMDKFRLHIYCNMSHLLVGGRSLAVSLSLMKALLLSCVLHGPSSKAAHPDYGFGSVTGSPP